MSKHQELFTVLNIDREDVTRAMGYDLGAELTDEDMHVLAGKLSNALSEIVSEVGFWSTVADVVESWLGTKEGTND